MSKMLEWKNANIFLSSSYNDAPKKVGFTSQLKLINDRFCKEIWSWSKKKLDKLHWSSTLQKKKWYTISIFLVYFTKTCDWLFIVVIWNYHRFRFFVPSQNFYHHKTASSFHSFCNPTMTQNAKISCSIEHLHVSKMAWDIIRYLLRKIR